MSTATSLRLTAVAFLACALTTTLLASVFDGWEWFLRALGALAVVSGTGALARWARTPRVVVPLLQIAGGLIYLTASFAAEAGRSGWVPTRDAFEALRELGDEGATAIDTVTPPVTPEDSIIFIVVAGVLAMALVVDNLAAGLRQTALAGLPLLVLYAVPAAVLPDGLPGELFLLPAIGFLLLLLTDNSERLSRWGVAITGAGAAARAGGQRGRMSRRIGLTVLVMSVAIPAFAPQLTDDAFGSGGLGNDPAGGGTISTLNPLVSMRRDLVRPEDVDLMTVRTDSARTSELYLRAVTLDTFDGEEWRAGRREVRKFDPELPDPLGLADTVKRTPTRTTVSVNDNLQADYVPMPYPPTRLEIDGEWRYDPLTGNIVSQSGADQLAGSQYSVEALDLDPNEDDVLGSISTDAYLRSYLQLPDSLPGRVREIADRVIGNRKDPLEQAITLQQWFRNPDNFVYDLRQQPGTGTNAILNFLDDRRGYCEQFASTMAVMARHLGIPARVNVGFTPGDLADDGLSRVISAHDAHAWPELWMQGVGWTRFEPTPGSATSNPSVPDWLAPADAQEEPDGGQSEENEEPRNGEEEPTPDGAENPGEQTEDNESGEVLPAPSDPGAGEDASSSPWYEQWTTLAAYLLVFALLAAAPGLCRVLIRRRRWQVVARAGADPVLATETAWTELRDCVADLGLPWPVSRTPRQTAAALMAEGNLGEKGLAGLALITHALERARYAPGVRTPVGADQLRDAVLAITGDLGVAAGRGARLRSRLAPRSVLEVLTVAGTRGADRFRASRGALARKLRPRSA
ncbi:MAG: transglutaminaseTgpA domain-containing protein [Sporichthyaceae bacterium]